MMAQYISKHPDVYNEAILGCSSQAYQRNIRDPDRWGGGIELSILSTIFDVQICTFDVQVRRLLHQPIATSPLLESCPIVAAAY